MTCQFMVVCGLWFHYIVYQNIEGQERVMIIRHSLPTNKFVRIDRKVFTDTRISDGAKVLYGYLCGLRNGANFSDIYILKATGISQRALTRRKRELKDVGLILVDQVTPRLYVIYIGHSNLSAESVKRLWNVEDDKVKDNG